MPDMTQEDLYEIRRQYATATNTSRFVINTVKASDNTYSRGKDKNNLSRSDRARIEAIKDRKLYPDDIDLFE